MAVYTTNLTIYTGTDFEQVFVLANDADNSPFNLTGYTGIAKIKKTTMSLTSTSFTTSFKSVTGGEVKLALSAGQTATLTPGRFLYDLLLYKDGENTKVIEGEVIIKKSITRY